MDECLRRTAIRNLKMYTEGIDQQLLDQFKQPPPEIPQFILDWFKTQNFDEEDFSAGSAAD